MNTLLLLPAFLLCDVFLSSFVVCRLLPIYPFGLFSYIWLMAFLKFLLLYGMGGRLLRRPEAAPGDFRTWAISLYLLVLSFTPPVYETTKLLIFWKPVEMHSGILLTLPVAIASGIACWVWEVMFPRKSEPEPTKNREDVSAEEKGKLKARVAFQRLLCYSKPDIVPMSAAFLFLALAVISEMFIPYYTGRVIDILGSQYETTQFQSAILYMSMFSVVSSISSGCRGGLFMLNASRLTCRLRCLLFKALVGQDIGFFESTKTGDITSRLSNDTTLVSRSIALNLNVFLRSLVKVIGIYSFMFNLSWQLTLLTFIDTPLTALLQNIYHRYYQDLVKKVQDSMARSNDLAGETVSAVKTVRTFATEDEEVKRYQATLMETHGLKTRRQMVEAVYLLARRLLQLAVHVAMLCYGQHLIRAGQMSIGHFVSFILYQMESGDHTRALISICENIFHSVGAAEKVFQYLDQKPVVCTEGSQKPDALRGHVQFRNVSFSYPTRPDIPVLQDVSFELKPGKITALVGPSGGGKTTCVCLLERFYDPRAGQILLDGRPIHQYDHKYLHSQISLVGQEPVLFSGSVKENITYGLRDLPMAEVERAAQQANADCFIQEMERGYETDVGERGGLLAGGQKQRIAVARALARHPRVLILDEVSSCLDVHSEQKLQDALSRIPDLTVLVIAHRLKTVEKANQIIVLEGGRVVEEGDHDQLLKKEGVYHRLIQRSFLENGTSE